MGTGFLGMRKLSGSRWLYRITGILDDLQMKKMANSILFVFYYIIIIFFNIEFLSDVGLILDRVAKCYTAK